MEFRKGGLGATIEDTGVREPVRGNRYLTMRRSNVWIRSFNSDGSLGKEIELLDRPHLDGSCGGHVIPYFKDAQGEWQLVLVEQFRLAIPGFMYEAAGGVIEEGDNWRETMVREAEEEIGVIIKDSEQIRLMPATFFWHTFSGMKMYGGLVEIKPEDLQLDEVYLDDKGNEFTMRVIMPLRQALKMRDAHEAFSDYLTSQLLDEVAKATGLLIKNY